MGYGVATPPHSAPGAWAPKLRHVSLSSGVLPRLNEGYLPNCNFLACKCACITCTISASAVLLQFGITIFSLSSLSASQAYWIIVLETCYVRVA